MGGMAMFLAVKPGKGRRRTGLMTGLRRRRFPPVTATA